MAGASWRSVGSAAAERPLTLDEALGVLRDAAQALGEAHAAGAVHGAVCADSLVLDERGATRLVRDEPAPAALSPEQQAGGPPDRRSDVYALGATVAELVAHVEPLPEPVRRMLAQMTLADPSARYQTMDEVLMALEACELMTGHRAVRHGAGAQGAGSRRGLLVGLVVALGIAMVVLALVVALGRTPEPRGKPPASYKDLVEKLAPMPDTPRPTTQP